MGVIAERTIRFVIAASLALAIMCFQTWWRYDFDTETSTIRGLSIGGITSFDGIIVLASAAVAGFAALIGLVSHRAQRSTGVAIAFSGLVALFLILYGLFDSPERVSTYPLSYITIFVHYNATLLLYFAAVTSFLIALAGAVLVRASGGQFRHKLREEGTEVWA